MDGQQLYQDGAQRIMAYLKQAFGKRFQAYYLGAPDAIPQSAFPCIIVQKLSGTTMVGPTMTDDVTEKVAIHVVADQKIGFNTPNTDDTTMRQIQTFIEGRDPDTGYYLPTSVLFVLRTNLTQDSRIINCDMVTHYDVSWNRDKTAAVAQGVIMCTITERIIVLNRT